MHASHLLPELFINVHTTDCISILYMCYSSCTDEIFRLLAAFTT